MNKKERPSTAAAQMRNLLEILAGTIFTAAAFGLFVVPMGFAAGGVTGLAKLMGKICPLSLSNLVLGINLAFLLLGLLCEGAAFAARTVGVSVLFPLLLGVFSQMERQMPSGAILIADILAAGAMLGMGAGLILRGGGSAGGFDIPAVVLNRKLKIPVAAVMNGADAILILIQAAACPLKNTLCGLAVILVSALFVEKAAGRKTAAIPLRRARRA